jgi:serine/threonine protein kinase
MNLPSIEQYQHALQQPLKRVFKDPALQHGAVELNPVGFPRIYAGNFALTYEIAGPSGKFAVRCFHRKSNGLALRYAAISSKLVSLHSKYFVPFEYVHDGISVDGQSYPIVKMGWAKGETISEFLSKNYKNKSKLETLRIELLTMGKFLASILTAHGDIQLGNLMVSSNGSQIQLIDYDGMYVPEIRNMGASEIGHRNFQHPKRSVHNFNERLDFFSLIALDLSLTALQKDPSIWEKTQSDEEGVVFRANDYADPSNSSTFSLVSRIPSLDKHVQNFAAICMADFDRIPCPSDFLEGKGLPTIAVVFKTAKQASDTKSTDAQHKYISSYPVISAFDYQLCVKNVGNRIELIGKIAEIQKGITQGRGARRNRPYVFINFGNKKSGQLVRVKIWSEGLDKLKALSTQIPDTNWNDNWVSVTGIVEPVYISKRYGYSDVSIIIYGAGQIKMINEKEASYRLGASPLSNGGERITTSNNLKIIDSMKASGKKLPTHIGTQRSYSPTNTPTKKPQQQSSGIPAWVWILGAVIIYFILKK